MMGIASAPPILRATNMARGRCEDVSIDVVPANAGTHNPWRAWLQKASASVSYRKDTAHGSQRFAGTTLLTTAPCHVRNAQDGWRDLSAVAQRAKAEAMPVMSRTTTMSFAKSTTHPATS